MSDPANDLREGSAAYLHPPIGTLGALGLGFLALLTLIPVTLPVAALKEIVRDRFDVSDLATSVFMSINMLAALLVAPLAGALSDWLGRRKRLIVLALVADGLLFHAMRLDLTYATFLGLRFLEGAAHILALSLLLALASDAAPPTRRGRVMGMVGGGLTLGVALGAPFGGKLAAYGALVPFEVGGWLSIAAAGFAALILRDVPLREGRPGYLEILRAVQSQRALLVPLAFAFVDRFSVGFFTTTFALYAGRIHGVPSASIGLLLAWFLFPFALLSYPFGRLADRTSPTLLLLCGSLVYGLFAATLGWWPASHLTTLMFILGVTSAVMFVPSLVLATELAPAASRATALGAFNAAGSLGFLIGPLAGGLISEAVARWHGWQAGYTAAFAVAGLAEVVCVLATLPFLLRLRAAGRVR